MNKYVALCLLVLSWCCCGAAAAAEQRDCASIGDAAERLACYDRLNERQADGAGQETEEAARQEARGREVEIVDLSTQADWTAETRKTEERRSRMREFFEQEEAAERQATIIEVRNHDRQKMILKLDNGEIWIQNSPRNLPFRVGDKVSVNPGTIGGFIIRNEKGVSSRFSRISR